MADILMHGKILRTDIVAELHKIAHEIELGELRVKDAEFHQSALYGADEIEIRLSLVTNWVRDG